MKLRIFFCLLALLIPACHLSAQGLAGSARDRFYPGQLWFDTAGRLINAHGGGILYYDSTYYWFGEYKGERTNSAEVGVTCYSSTDLYNWTDRGIALAVSDEADSPIVRGCIIERPKVIHNARTGKFVMYFHLELKGKGYAAANVGVAVSDRPEGPYRFVKNGCVNPGQWPADLAEADRAATAVPEDYEWWTPAWRDEVARGLFVRRDRAGGQMSRDMTLFVDDDGKAYHIYASEENLTLQIAELTDDYLDYTGRYVRVDPTGQNEAPALFKKDGRYYLITSGCTGWAPNAARLFTAESIRGPWQRHANPCQGDGADRTFQSQGTYVLPVAGRKDAFVFMADSWRPDNPIDGRYVWLPVRFENGLPVLRWEKEWSLDVFGR